MRLFDFIIFMVFDYFNKKDPNQARANTINFTILLGASTLIPLFMLLNLVFQFFESPKDPNPNMKYYIGIPLGIGLLIINSIFLKGRLTIERLQEFKTNYPKNNKLIVWIIFITPIVFVFLLPIIYGTLNGTLKILV